MALACLLLKVGQTLGRESECTPLLNSSMSIRHSTLYHITGMRITAHPGERMTATGAKLRSAWTLRLRAGQAREDTRPHTSKGRRGEPRLY